jgi:phosphomannomutase
MAALKDELSYQPLELAFGTSGLRGLITDMTDLECYINTRGFLDFLQLPQGATVYVAGDLRDSTPRIMAAVHRAIADSGFSTVYCGLIPTPALAFYALQNQSACVMVTGSHIPADRNGIKFYKTDGEVLKDDETAIKTSVATVRDALYSQDMSESAFTATGSLRELPDLPGEDVLARQVYIERYVEAFGGAALAGKEIVFYQHSAVGRDILVDLLQALGATVTPTGRSDTFVPIDTENVTPADQKYFRTLADDNPDAFAIVSTDGDSDRPFVIDATGEFHRGDVLGAVVAEWLEADFAAYPVSASDAVDMVLDGKGIAKEHTRIGSPYVVKAMDAAAAAGKQRVTGWEVNGGFLLGADMRINGATLKALPTRDAILPIIVALLAAHQDNIAVADVFAQLPARFTQAGLINDFPNDVSKEIVTRLGHDTPEVRQQLGQYFTPAQGFDKVRDINNLDGVRLYFENGDIAHLRPSGNAPQLRIYSVAASQARADEIVALALAEPNGIFRTIQNSL